MRKNLRKILSVTLAAAMLLTHVQYSYAAGDGSEADSAASLTEESRALEMEPMDPAKLGIKKLGEEIADGSEAADPDLSGLTPDLSLEKTVRVSIFLDEKSTIDAGFDTKGIAENKSAAAYRDTLRKKQTDLTAKIESVLGHTLDVKWNLTLLTNAISANVKVKEIPLIERLAGVRKVELEKHYDAPVTEGDAQPQTANTSENMVGAVNAWYQLGYTGAGTRIAIIDTGLDTNHQSVDADAFNHAIEEVRDGGKTVELMTQISAAVANQLNSKSSNYINAKIPYAYNYVDGGTRVDHQDSGSNHGSHVAGIAAANRYIKSGSNYVDAAGTVGAVGMAPDAQILVMKVFSSSGASDSDYFAALEDAIILGADAANLSLGSSAPGWTYDTEYQTVLNSFVNNKTNNHMVISISAGNSYAADDFVPSGHLYAEDASFHTGGSPGSFINSLGVAAAQNTLTTGTPLMFNGDQQVFYAESTEDSDGNAYSNPAITTIAGTYSYVYIDAVGAASDYSTVNSAVSLSGKIVIVNRGSLNFADKGNNAKSYSPKAVIIANNAEGTIHMDLSEFTGTFPMVSILLKDAQQIKENSTVNTAGGITYYTGSVQVTTTEVSTVAAREDAEITDFSSWGVPGSLIMKPEITAPGGDIYSINGTSSSDTGSGTDKYVSYSGTSMAAPHIAGLAAVLMQYLKEKTPANTDLMNGYNLRAVAQSLLMSTATPMINSNAYLSILQQGAGLAEVSKAIEAKSVIMMDEAGLTTSTKANTDGKVKVELGDDSERKGEYDFSFTIYNISDKTLTFELATDLFTQRIDNGDTLSHKTVLLPEDGVTYVWNGTAPAAIGHDVDKDGDTDNDDAQAILDFLSGEKAEEDVDLTVADMDGDENVTSRDAYLLIDWTAEAPEEGYTVAAGDKAQVSVHIKLTDAQKAVLDDELRRGAYLEGFTYVTCVTADEEGVSYAHEHSIPILGYYGSWTDPSMFDTNSYTESLYGNEQQNYSGNTAESTNYMRITTNGTLAKFSGNPYIVEEDEEGDPVFPEERLAIRSDAKINDIAYNLIRSAAGTGFAISKLDVEGNIDRIVSSAVTGQYVNGCWFYVNQGTWQDTMTKTYNVSKALNEFNGLAEGDRVRVGFYAIPEYYPMKESEDLTQAESGELADKTMFEDILKNGQLGKGAFMGFDFTIDDTAPEVTDAVLSGNTLSITASDNQALAYVAVLSLDGTVQYAEAAPGTETYTVSFDASDAIANANGYVAAFAGDYAGNEAAVAVKVNNNTHVEKTVYVLTDTLEAGHDYLIVNRNTAGTGYGLTYTTPTGSNATTATATTFAPAVKAGNTDTGNKPYIESSDVPDNGVWKAASGVTLSNASANKTWYIGRSSSNSLTVGTAPRYSNWTYTNNRLRSGTSTRYLYCSGNSFTVGTATTSVYLYVKTTITYEVDPYSVMSVTVTPNTLELYKGNTAALTAKVAPLTASPRTVTWNSSNTNVATVNENGIVTAVGAGTATIRATSTADSTKYGECVVTVVTINKELSAAIWDEAGDVYFSYFNTNNLPTWTKRHNTAAGEYITSALMASTSALYASTNDLSVSNIFTVDRTSYALTELGENYVVAFGMAPVGSSFGSGYFVYAFAKYLIFGNLEPETDENLGTYSGFPYGLLDLSTTEVCEAYAVAICIRNRSTTSAGYYFLDENGKIWQTNQTYSSTSGISFGTPTLVYDTGITAGLTYNSIYYDGTNLYWSHQEGEYAKLYILANANTAASRKFYDAGNFGDGVWPAAGLYVNGSVAPAFAGSENEIMAAGEGTIDLSSLKLQISRDKLFTADIQARFAAEAENLKAGQAAAENAAAETAAEAPAEEIAEPVPVEIPADETAESSAEAATEAPADETEEADGSAAADQTEELDTPSEDKPEEETSAEEDVSEEELSAEENTEAVGSADEETVMAELPPEMTGGLNIARVTLRKEFITDAAELNAAAVETSETEPGMVTVKITDESAVNNGLYSVVYDPEFMTVKTMESPAAYKSFCDDTEKGVITFAFADKTAVEAGNAIATITFTVTSCEDIADGIEVITLERNETVDLSDSQLFDVTGTGHAWGEPTWTWTGNETDGYTAATATFVCKRDSEHTKEETASVSYEVTKEPTTEAEGEGAYTATVTVDGTEYTDVKVVTLPKLPVNGYHILVTDYTKGKATTSINAEQLYSGEVSFTVACSSACVVAIDNGDDTYERLTCTTTEAGEHQFTVTVSDADVKLVVVIKGDANLNGTVTAVDASMTAREAALNLAEKPGILSPVARLAADVIMIGRITSVDASVIAREAATQLAGNESIMEW